MATVPSPAGHLRHATHSPGVFSTRKPQFPKHTRVCGNNIESTKKHSWQVNRGERLSLGNVFVLLLPHNVTCRVRTNRFCGSLSWMATNDIRFVGIQQQQNTKESWEMINYMRARSQCPVSISVRLSRQRGWCIIQIIRKTQNYLWILWDRW